VTWLVIGSWCWEKEGVVVGKLRFSDEIGVSGVGIGVLGKGSASATWARKSPPGSGPAGGDLKAG
jgi:hypothetical protein